MHWLAYELDTHSFHTSFEQLMIRSRPSLQCSQYRSYLCESLWPRDIQMIMEKTIMPAQLNNSLLGSTLAASRSYEMFAIAEDQFSSTDWAPEEATI